MINTDNKNFIIVADSTCDFPDNYIKENNLKIIELSYTLNGIEYDGVKNPFQSPKEFYDEVRNGAMPKTSQINISGWKDFFNNILKTEDNILCISFSSALSGTCHNAGIAAKEINEKNPSKKIIVIDSLSASLGQGLLVHYALKLQKEGKCFEEVCDWVDKNKLHFCHNFTVDNLNHLYRGGRVSKMAAVFGTVLQIKPVLHMDNFGRLIPLDKVRGRKQSLISLVDMMGERIKGYENDICFISHGDCVDDANFVRDLVNERFAIKKFLINDVGSVIGSHSGPGTVALFFMGNKR